MDKRQQIRKYFAPYPKWITTAVIIGIIGTIAFFGLGLILIGIAIYSYFRWKAKPSDREYDNWVREELANLEETALKKTGVAESELVRDSIMINYPRSRNIGGAEFGIKVGDSDGLIRYMPQGATVICFTEDYLAFFHCIVDMTTGNILNQGSETIYYSEIVAIQTKTECLTINEGDVGSKVFNKFPALRKQFVDGKLQINDSEKFILTTRGGSTVEVALRDPIVTTASGGGSLPSSLGEQAVAAVRSMVTVKRKS